MDMSALYNLFEHTTDAIFGIDKNQHIRFWNKNCEQLLGFTAQQAIGKPCAELLCVYDLQGNQYSTDNCPISKPGDQTLSHQDLIIKQSDKIPIMVNIGSYYLKESEYENNRGIQVFYSIRKINSYQLIQRLANNSSYLDSTGKIQKLSKREYEVLKMVSKGVTSRCIAAQLGISVATVRNHMKNTYAKLDVHSKAEAIGYAMRHGLA